MKLGLIAGNGRFPFLVLDAARAQGHDVTVIAAKEEAFKDLEDEARKVGAAFHWVSIFHLGTCIKHLKEAGATQVVMAGQVKHTRIFAGGASWPDLTALSILRKFGPQNTDGIIGAVAGVLNDHGLEVINSTSLLEPMLAKAGVLTERMPTTDEQRDFDFGYPMADAIAGLDVGQTIAVKDRAVVAVEAMEGTDEVIGRAGHLAGAGVRIIKVAKPKQDMRFDVPVIGLATIQAMRVAGASALSIDAGRTLVFDKDALLASANDAGIAIVGRTPRSGSSA